MKNPIGPYPGRQLFAGQTTEGNPCLAYLVTGRSSESRARKATLAGSRIIIGPLGAVEYDPLRHYTAVQFDNSTGVAAVSNGIQTEAVFETYRLLHNVSSPPARDYIEKIMEGAGAEPDSYHTPRIAAIVTDTRETGLVLLISIKRHDRPAAVFQVGLERGRLSGISVYNGALETPAPYDPSLGLPQLHAQATTPDALARHLFDISAASHNGEDIRVCAVGAMRRPGEGWDIAIVNAH